MKTAFLTFEQHLGRKDIGSSRIRAKWPVKYWNQAGPDIGSAELFKMGGKYDTIIFQKVYWPEYARAFKGKKILDLCDPDWLHWSYKVKEMIEEVDAITCSSLALAKAVERFAGDKPVYVISDRIDFEQIKRTKEHKGDAKIAVWYGYSQNYPMLDTCIPALKRAGMSLIVIADKVYTPASNSGIEVTNLPWTAETWIEDILKGDIVLNPKGSSNRFKYKSDNKTTLAWALGMPVATNEEELASFASETARIKEAEIRTKLAREEYDVKLSVVDLKEIIQSIEK